ncbi:MAG: hypothetical protein RRC34_02645 [Lentisphaeria bacterium]|nr:hypothetical protein [Lentisphaeria bacterium]
MTKQLIIGLTIAMAVVSWAEDAPQKNTSEKDTLMVTTALTAAAFRKDASGDIDAAVKKWGSEFFQNKWRRSVMTMFEKTEKIEWHDFFSGAVVWAGATQAQTGISACYNPWSDAIVLLKIEGSPTAQKLTDFAVVCGESWREETPKTAAELFHLNHDTDPLLIQLASYYNRTLDIFKQVYQTPGKAELMPGDFGKRFAPPDEELALIKTRMIHRLYMYQQLFSGKHTSIKTLAGDIVAAIHADGDELVNMMTPGASAEAAAMYRELPAPFRQEVGPIYFATQGKGFILAFVSANAPKYVLIISSPDTADENKKLSCECLDLDVSKQTLNLWREVAK